MTSIPLILGKLASGFSDITIQMAKFTILRFLRSSLAKVAGAPEPPVGMEWETTGSEGSLMKERGWNHLSSYWGRDSWMTGEDFKTPSSTHADSHFQIRNWIFPLFIPGKRRAKWRSTSSLPELSSRRWRDYKKQERLEINANDSKGERK